VTTDRERLHRLLGDEELSWLVARIRRRLSRGEPLTGVITRAEATAAERAAVRRLLGRPPRPGASLTVSLPAVDEVVRRSGACPDGLAAAIVALTGLVVDTAAASVAVESAWERALAPLAEVVDERPVLIPWYERARSTGLVRRLAGTPEIAADLIADLVAVLRRLPASGRPLGAFAAEVTGDAHALDDDRPLATLVLGAARELAALPDGQGAQWRREIWAAVGVLRDDLSTTVLTLGLPGDPDIPTGRALNALREAGQPAVLTLRQLVRDPPVGHAAGTVVSVCENPVVVSYAADRLGPRCAPLVCTFGQPRVAVLHLLRMLTARGATVRFHCDFDWGGVRIGTVLFDRFPVVPWRFDAKHYRAAADTLAGRPLKGNATVARWDTDLAPAMVQVGMRIEEELLLDDLIRDLGQVPPPRSL
jgi:uncharacterized protein (TIGR02679 family)